MADIITPPRVTEAQAAAIVSALVQELHAELHAGAAARFTLDSALERELGFDSLARVELLSRLERAFAVTLPETVLTSAETPRDLVRAVLQAAPQAVPVMPAAVAPLAGKTVTPEHAETLVAVLLAHVATTPERPHLYLQDEHGAESANGAPLHRGPRLNPAGESVLSYRALLDAARAVAGGLIARDLAPGETVALMLPTGLDYFHTFFGILLAGGIPVPVYPPARPSQIEEHLRRHTRLLNNAEARLLVAPPEAHGLAQLLRAHVPGLRAVVSPEELRRAAPATVLPAVRAEDIALLQYTSGSTGQPKGVVLTHANLLANLRAMGRVTQVSSRDCFVSWMPLYHDMGLIGAWLGSLYFGMPLVVMSPLTFLAHPQRWLWAIHQHRATLSGAPNFGYELCLRKVDEAALAGLDLSSWRLAFNGAEPVSPDTLAHFAARFARYGLRPEALAPVYGLAECALGLAFPPPGRAPVIDRVARERFLHSGQALPAAADDATALRFVGCGQVLPDHAIRIVGETGTPLGERRQGRVEFRGPSTTSGYYRNPEVTAQLFDDGWLDSGDLGYLADSELYLTGRVKDVIIRAGRNVHPQELEEAVGNVSGIRKGCVAVFGARPAGATAEQLIVLAEIRAGTAMSAEALRATINDLALRLIGMPPDDIVLAAPHTVLKTSSGKIRRAASRELYERGLLRAPTRPPWRQLLAVTWTAAWPELRRGLQQLGGIGFAVYTWLLFAVLAPFTWALVSLLPHAPAQRTIHRIARLFIALSGTPLTVRGREHLPAGPCMLVANHASYLDGIILTAVLAPGFAYVAKREFLTQFIARVFLRAIGAEFVERFEAGRGVEDAARLTACLRAGATLLVFPEGGFRRAPGLLPFRLGAFVAAGDAGVRVVPCALRGTRGVLRAGSWWPRRGAITLTVGAPLTAHGTDFRAALQLRDAARAAVLRDCGEPDLTALRV